MLGSSADINPIGSISKVDLKRFIAWASNNFDMAILDDFINAIPTAELEPITADYVSVSPGKLNEHSAFLTYRYQNPD